MPEYKLVEELTGNGYETVIQYHGNGSIYYQIWYLNGKLHRKDGPAYIEYKIDGSIANISWKINGKYHRKDGPAWIRYYDNDTISKSWDLNGIQLHKYDFTSIKMVEKMKAQELFTLKELLKLKRNV